MTGTKEILVCIGVLGAPFASGHCFIGIFYYAWLSAADPANWPQMRATIWASISLALAIIFLGLFIQCLRCLTKAPNKCQDKSCWASRQTLLIGEWETCVLKFIAATRSSTATCDRTELQLLFWLSLALFRKWSCWWCFNRFKILTGAGYFCWWQ